MADITQNVIIEFISDVSQLQPAVDQLEKIGKIETGQAAAFKATNTEINKQAAALKNVSSVNDQISATGKVTKKNVADLAASVKGMSATFQKEFKAGIVDGLKQAGVSMKDFEKTLDNSFGKSEQATISLKAQLRQMVEQLAKLKIQGKDTGAEYLDLAQKAGKLKDAIGDANLQVKNFGSDTSAFDGLLSLTSGLAGGFAVAQGATALFGDESEELQKTLLRVNAAMAILQGLQQIQTVLQKESAASQFLNTVATKGQAAALAIYNFVVGTSTGLTKAFKIALASTGIGLIIIGLYQLVTALRETNTVLEDTNKFIEDQNKLLDDNRSAIQRNTEERLATLEAAGRLQSEILLAQEAANIREQNAISKSTKILIEQRKEIDKVIALKKSLGAGIGDEIKAWNSLNESVGKNNEELSKLQSDQRILITKTGAAVREEEKKAAEERKSAAKQAAEDAKKAREDQLQKEKEARAQGFADNKAFVELQLLAVQKGSEEELRIKKELLRAELQKALDNDKLTENQRKLLIKKFFSERLDLEKQFAKDRDKIILENIGSDIQAELQGLELSNEKKLELTETAIQIQAQLEIDAANGNAAKIAEINAKRDRAIRDARIASIQEVVNYEISLAEAANGPGKRRLQATVANAEAEVSARKSAIDELAGIDSGAIQKRIDALNTERQQKLISEKDYQLQYTQLVDQQTVIWEEAEKKKTEITKSESEKRIAQIKKDIESTVMVAAAVSDILSSIADIQAQIENEKLSRDRSKIKELQDAGAITEKEAIARMKKLDLEERNIKRRQAQRDKAIALFNAVINTAKGIAAAIPNPFLIAFAAIVGAAQIALIAARPIPQFAKGKKGRYEGLAEVGEAGSELVEHDGRMYLAKKPQVIWVGKSDKVYSHKETVEMMSKPGMSTERNGVLVKTDKGITIDYEKMGEAVGKHVQQNIYVDGIQEQAIKKKEFINYINTRRSF